MSLRRTPSRLRRLEEVERREIAKYGDGQSYDRYAYRVTAAMEELRRAGWVVLPTSNDPPYKRRWVITEAGKAVLARAREKAK